MPDGQIIGHSYEENLGKFEDFDNETHLINRFSVNIDYLEFVPHEKLTPEERKKYGFENVDKIKQE